MRLYDLEMAMISGSPIAVVQSSKACFDPGAEPDYFLGGVRGDPIPHDLIRRVSKKFSFNETSYAKDAETGLMSKLLLNFRYHSMEPSSE